MSSVLFQFPCPVPAWKKKPLPWVLLNQWKQKQCREPVQFDAVVVLFGELCNSGWPQIHYTVKDVLELLSCLHILSAGTVGEDHCSWFIQFWGSNPGLFFSLSQCVWNKVSFWSLGFDSLVGVLFWSDLSLLSSHIPFQRENTHSSVPSDVGRIYLHFCFYGSCGRDCLCSYFWTVLELVKAMGMFEVGLCFRYEKTWVMGTRSGNHALNVICLGVR